MRNSVREGGWRKGGVTKAGSQQDQKEINHMGWAANVENSLGNICGRKGSDEDEDGSECQEINKEEEQAAEAATKRYVGHRYIMQCRPRYKKNHLCNKFPWGLEGVAEQLP